MAIKPKRGAPFKPEKREKAITVRFTVGEHAAIVRASIKAHMESASAYVRKLVLEGRAK